MKTATACHYCGGETDEHDGYRYCPECVQLFADCPGCGYQINGPVWGPDGLCRDCYEDGIPSPYCKHGTYIGYPGGPDYLCGPCEME